MYSCISSFSHLSQYTAYLKNQSSGRAAWTKWINQTAEIWMKQATSAGNMTKKEEDNREDENMEKKQEVEE